MHHEQHKQISVNTNNCYLKALLLPFELTAHQHPNIVHIVLGT